jgi:FKBP-type peptidyl-prolyl cis-trans isomerase FkpA
MTKRSLTLAARVGGLASIALFGLAGCDRKVPEPENSRIEITPEPETPELPEMLKEDVVVGTGAEAKKGDKVHVNYTGKLLKTGLVFDTSIGKKPFDFTIGEGGVIKGWDEGVPGMKVGGKRKLTIPSKLAYGDKGSPPKIPAKATLVFDIELLGIGDEKDAGAADGGKDDKSKGKDKKK